MNGDDTDKGQPGVTDELLSALGAQARAERNEGTAEEDPQVQALLTPFSEEDMASLVAQAMAAREQEAQPEEASRSSSPGLRVVRGGTEGSSAADAADEDGEEAPGRMRRVWLAVVPVLAAAALLVLWLRPVDPGGPTLPGYSLVAMQGALVEQRSAADGPQARPRYATDGRITWILEPARAVEGPVVVGIFAQGEEQSRWLPLKGSVEVSEQGVVRIDGEVQSVLGLSAGQWSLTVLIGPSGSLPADAATAEAALSDDEPDPWQRHTQAIEIVESDPR